MEPQIENDLDVYIQLSDCEEAKDSGDEMMDSSPADDGLLSQFQTDVLSDVSDRKAEIIFAHRVKLVDGLPPTLEYLVKWKDWSHWHNSWVERSVLMETNPMMLKNFENRMVEHSGGPADDPEEVIEEECVDPTWLEIDRIVDERTEDGEKEYLVKWCELAHSEMTWESEENVLGHDGQCHIDALRHRVKIAYEPKEKDANGKRAKEAFSELKGQPKSLTSGPLFEYQMEGLNWLLYSFHNKRNVMLADEMGLGKTVQTIAFVSELLTRVPGPFLVVAPLSTLRNWQREFAKWASHINVVVCQGNADARALMKEHEIHPKGRKSGSLDKSKYLLHVLLTTYECAVQERTFLAKHTWTCVIVDEAQRLKSTESRLSTVLRSVPCAHRVLLTGTPLQNNLDELWGLLSFLDPKKFGTEFDDESFSKITQEDQIRRLHELLKDYILRRLKKDVLKSVPPKVEIVVPVSLSQPQRLAYRSLVLRNRDMFAKVTGGSSRQSLLNTIMQLRKVCAHTLLFTDDHDPDAQELSNLVEGSSKMELLDKMLSQLKAAGHRVLVYSQFARVLDLIERLVELRQYDYERIDGSVGGSDRQAAIDRFNEQGSTAFCFLLTTRAGGIGINLQTADTVILFDSDWNPFADTQAFSRAHRMGQKHKVFIYRLVCRGTVEERILQTANKKKALEHIVVRKMRDTLRAGELQDILRHGVAELFSEDPNSGTGGGGGGGGEGLGSYDDTAITQLLDREGVQDQQDSTEDDELFNFKVALFERSSAAEPHARLALTDMDSVVVDHDQAQTPSQEFWNSVIGGGGGDVTTDDFSMAMEMQKQQQEEELGRGKRVRRQRVSATHSTGLSDISSGSDSERGNKREKKRSKKARAGDNVESAGKRKIATMDKDKDFVGNDGEEEESTDTASSDGESESELTKEERNASKKKRTRDSNTVNLQGMSIRLGEPQTISGSSSSTQVPMITTTTSTAVAAAPTLAPAATLPPAAARSARILGELILDIRDKYSANVEKQFGILEKIETLCSKQGSDRVAAKAEAAKLEGQLEALETVQKKLHARASRACDALCQLIESDGNATSDKSRAGSNNTVTSQQQGTAATANQQLTGVKALLKATAICEPGSPYTVETQNLPSIRAPTQRTAALFHMSTPSALTPTNHLAPISLRGPPANTTSELSLRHNQPVVAHSAPVLTNATTEPHEPAEQQPTADQEMDPSLQKQVALTALKRGCERLFKSSFMPPKAEKKFLYKYTVRKEHRNTAFGKECLQLIDQTLEDFRERWRQTLRDYQASHPEVKSSTLDSAQTNALCEELWRPYYKPNETIPPTHMERAQRTVKRFFKGRPDIFKGRESTT